LFFSAFAKQPFPSVTSLFPLRQGAGGPKALPIVRTLVEMHQMDVAASQFDFVAGSWESTEPEEGSIAWAKEYMARFVKLSEEHQGLYTRAQAARFLRVSHQAIEDLVKRGQIQVIELDHGIFLSGRDILKRLGGVKGKPGRPRLRDALDLQK
jgi:hypothetical protein